MCERARESVYDIMCVCGGGGGIRRATEGESRKVLDFY